MFLWYPKRAWYPVCLWGAEQTFWQIEAVPGGSGEQILRLCQQLVIDVAVDVGEAEVSAGVAVG